MNRQILPLFLLLPLAGCTSAVTKAASEGRLKDVMAALPSPSAINKCVQCPAAVNWQGDHYFSTLLGCAAWQGQFEVVKALLEKGASAKDRCMRSALNLASKEGHVEIVDLLLANGADPNEPGRYSSLGYAAESGKAAAVRSLLQAGADVDKEDSSEGSGRTALYWAVRSGNADVTRALLEYCADDRRKGGFPSKNAHDVARQNKREDLVQLLSEYEGKEACLRNRQKRKTESELRRIGDLENAGIDLEKQGRLEDAIGKFSQALDAIGDKGRDEMRLRINKRIFQAAARGRLSVPEDAKRFSIRAQMLVKQAKSAGDLNDAVAEFKKAVRAAPWWPEAYFNLGLIQEKAGRPAAAMRNLKLYLLASPGARDAEAVERKIIELEFKVERSGQ